MSRGSTRLPSDGAEQKHWKRGAGRDGWETGWAGLDRLSGKGAPETGLKEGRFWHFQHEKTVRIDGWVPPCVGGLGTRVQQSEGRGRWVYCASPGFLRGSHPQGSVCPVPSAAPAWCFSVNALSEDLLGTWALAILPDFFVCFYLKAVPACPFTKICIRPFSRTLGKQSRALFSV